MTNEGNSNVILRVYAPKTAQKLFEKTSLEEDCFTKDSVWDVAAEGMNWYGYDESYRVYYGLYDSLSNIDYWIGTCRDYEYVIWKSPNDENIKFIIPVKEFLYLNDGSRISITLRYDPSLRKPIIVIAREMKVYGRKRSRVVRISVALDAKELWSKTDCGYYFGEPSCNLSGDYTDMLIKKLSEILRIDTNSAHILVEEIEKLFKWLFSMRMSPSSFTYEMLKMIQEARNRKAREKAGTGTVLAR